MSREHATWCSSRMPCDCDLAQRSAEVTGDADKAPKSSINEADRRSEATGVEAGVAQKVRARSGESTPETASAAVQAAEEQRACNPEVPGSTPGPSLDARGRKDAKDCEFPDCVCPAGHPSPHWDGGGCTVHFDDGRRRPEAQPRNVALADAIVANNASTAALVGFVTWIAEHPDVGDSLTAADRERDFQRKAKEVLAGRGRSEVTLLELADRFEQRSIHAPNHSASAAWEEAETMLRDALGGVAAAQPGDPTVRHVVAWMRQTFPQNQHAREWADEIERVFLRRAAATSCPHEKHPKWCVDCKIAREAAATRQAIDVVCPYCKAKPGEVCRDVNTGELTTHESRDEEAEIQNRRGR